ncbi:hypothetical protein NX059_010227 [Plenodomus lindquistii]|nr:hypothetical protein NX059_010227 [Plenodomus lindquistii]
MYSYYQKSSRCYVYLNKKMQGRHLTIEELHSTRWITRGWTLQEMLAPSVVHFYDVRWMFCGDAQDLKEQLEAATGIETSLYDPRESVHSWKYTIATKMSWASKRVTTRPEDMAYCLFGLFNVHLPPLYGEGQAAAFRRIQEEIIKKSMDLSFLVWELEERDARWAGALALSPKAFQGCLVDAVYSSFKLEPFHITNKGLRVTLPLIKINKESLERKFEEYIMVLPNCRKRSHPEGLCSGVRVAVNSRQDVFYRYRSSGMARAQIVSVSVQMMAEAAVRTFYLATN